MKVYYIMLVIMFIMLGYRHLIDVNGAFLLVTWEPNPTRELVRHIYMEMPQGFGAYF